MIKSNIQLASNGMITAMSDDLVQQVMAQNVFCPEITNVVYNLKTETNSAVRDVNGNLILGDNGKPVRESKPCKAILATTVTFEDGSKVTVKNSDNDPVIFNEDGTVAIESKERGLVYAIVKRLISVVSKDKMRVESPGFGRFLNSCVKNAYDCQVEAAKKLAAKRAKKDAAKNAQTQPKRKRVSLSTAVQELYEVSKQLRADLDAVRADR